MSDQIIPLTNDPNQTLTVSITVGSRNINLGMGIRWNSIAGYWVLTVIDPNTGMALIDSIPLITGKYPAGNLLGQYAYMGIGAAYLVNALNSAMDYPDTTNLGSDFQLVWSDD